MTRLATILCPILSLALLAPLPVMADDTALSLPLTARGNEPGWSVTVAADGSRYSDIDGATLAAPFAPPRAENGGWSIDTAAGLLRLTPGICRDTMTGMPHPFAATLEREATTLSGCAGDPSALLAGNWVATEVDGAALPADAGVTLSFRDGGVAGRAACNRFTGGLGLTGEGLSFGPLAATRMACAPAVMERERTVLAALADVARFDIDDQGSLSLLAADGSVRLRARR